MKFTWVIGLKLKVGLPMKKRQQLLINGNTWIKILVLLMIFIKYFMKVIARSKDRFTLDSQKHKASIMVKNKRQHSTTWDIQYGYLVDEEATQLHATSHIQFQICELLQALTFFTSLMHYPSSLKRNQTTTRKLVIIDVVLMQCKRNSRPLRTIVHIPLLNFQQE